LEKDREGTGTWVIAGASTESPDKEGYLVGQGREDRATSHMRYAEGKLLRLLQVMDALNRDSAMTR
jgi:hypothetical protein